LLSRPPKQHLWIFKALTKFFRLPEAPLRPVAFATLATWIIWRWSSKWVLTLKPSKCKVIHGGHRFGTMYRFNDEAGDSNRLGLL